MTLQPEHVSEPTRSSRLSGQEDGGGVPGADSKLKRDVAIKVLPQSLAADSDALVRFERERPRQFPQPAPEKVLTRNYVGS